MVDPYERGSDPDCPALFPSRVFGRNSLSVQADSNGYACTPRKRFDDIRDYDSVEVTVWGPDGRVNPRDIAGFPKGLASVFEEDGIARHVSDEFVQGLERHLKVLAASDTPLRDPDRSPIGITDEELAGVLGTIEGAIFSGQGGMDEGTLAFGRRLLELAQTREIDIEPYRELRTHSEFDEPTASPAP